MWEKIENALRSHSKEERDMEMKQLTLGPEDLGGIELTEEEKKYYEDEVVPILKRWAKYDEK